MKRFPKIMKSKNKSGLIVLFSKSMVGTVLMCEDKYHSVGDHRVDWIPTSFEDYHKTIEELLK